MQMIPFNYLPVWRPDLHLSLKVGDKDTEPKRYFLDIWDGTRPFFVSVRKVRAYLNYAEEGDWPEDYDFPSILMICDTDKDQKKLNRQVRKALDESSEDETVFATTTNDKFVIAQTGKDKIWELVDLDGDDPGLLSIGDL
jgi:hypothetical protein